MSQKNDDVSIDHVEQGNGAPVTAEKSTQDVVPADQPETEKEVAAKKESPFVRYPKRFFHSLWQPPPEKPPSFWYLVTHLTNTQRLTFTAAFLGWTVDAYDYFCVSLSVPSIAAEFGVVPSEVTAAITTTLVRKSLLGDKYGRRWPLMIDIVLFSLINMASGFAPNLQTFIGLRAVFGIAMGGEWGLGASLALETLPIEARGLFSGIYQQGYACGYLLAALVNFAVSDTKSSWRIMFWTGAVFALLAVAIRFFVPESPTFAKTKEARDSLGHSYTIYMIILMSFFNFYSHGSQDLYPTFLKVQLGYTPAEQSVTTVLHNIGAIIGGTIVGLYSNYLGRRICIVFSACMVGCFIPLWIYGPNIHSLRFGAFVLQFFIQGAWGIVPAHLNELAPSGFRGLMPGLSYQLGNLVSAASSQIQATIGEQYPLRNPDGSLQLRGGKSIPDYGLVQAIFMGCVVACLIITALCGKEERNKDFSQNFYEDEHGQAVTNVQERALEEGTATKQ
ncbi:major facilitator superfamily domain-containing protein [Fennellomyces sp. T-0311]|nr:major facilitator superfamily domain-containing protein [Fennellomyces sp. T-0311]